MKSSKDMDVRSAKPKCRCGAAGHGIKLAPKPNTMKRSRPDGMNALDYADTKNWDSNRWAWEFLRRDSVFSEISRELAREPDAEEEVKIAAAYGLKKFKSAFEDFDEPGRQKPRFLLSSVHFQARVTEKDLAGYTRKLQVGEIVFKFSLTEALVNSAALDAKVRQVRQLAWLQLLELQHQRSSPEGLLIGDPDDWLESLRLLDALHAKQTLLEIGRALSVGHFGASDTPLESDKEMITLIKKRKAKADFLTQKGYLCIAACLADRRVPKEKDLQRGQLSPRKVRLA